jgi:hypothetical protein
MGEPIAVLALRKRRDHISGIIAEYERKIKDAQHDLIHVVAFLQETSLSGLALEMGVNQVEC